MLVDVLHTIISGSVHTLLLGDVGVARRVSHSQNIRLNRSLASLSLPLSPHDCPSIQRTVNNQILSVQVTMCRGAHPRSSSHTFTHSLADSFLSLIEEGNE